MNYLKFAYALIPKQFERIEALRRRADGESSTVRDTICF